MSATDLFKKLPGDSRLTTLPLARPNLFKWYEDAARSFWTPAELPLSEDAMHYKHRLSPQEKHFVKHILAFFAASDGIVNVNIAKRFKKDVSILEATYFYDMQTTMENIHAHTYSLLLDEIIPDANEKAKLLNAIETMPIIKKMSEYMFKIIESSRPFAERVLRMACVEGIFFTGCFCVIYWLQSRGLMPALGQSNELIARDEALHTVFAIVLYDLLESHHKLSQLQIHEILNEAVSLAKEFIAEALPNGMSEMNAGLMGDYIECQADNIITLLDLPALFGTKNAFHFMDQINLVNRTNYFERRVSEYAKGRTVDDDGGHDDDF